MVALEGIVAAQTPAPDPQAPQFEETVDVVAVTPLHGLGVARDKVPANIQTATAADMARIPGVQVSDVLAVSFGSVSVNEAQGSSLQPDILFRGFAASPLLGLPQGVAVYQDGVRINEPFGDTVHWDILPANAVASVNLMPGSNPLFGLNALGGALSLQTKTGFSHPGHSATLFGGSFGRAWTDLQTAGHGDRFSYFVSSRLLSEDGWRDFSESDIRQVFGNLGWQTDRTRLNFAVTAGANRLIGNGAVPELLLEEDRSAVFTHPDETEIDMGLLTFTARRQVHPRLSLDAAAFYRPATIETFNGDDSGYEACDDEELEGLLCEEDEDEPIVDQSGNLVFVNGRPFDATNNTSSTRSHGWGGSAQMALAEPVGARANDFIAGVSIEAGRSRYESDTELAELTESRGTIGTGILDSGAAVRLESSVRHVGFYAADFLTVAPRVTLMGSARFTHSTVELRDQLGDDLTGDHAFSRLNPAVGVTVTLGPEATAYGSFSMSSRVPTPSELGCADPDDPCRLPNAFVADPPLEQVTASTIEGGMRGRFAAQRLTWNASVFHTVNRDDILFVSSGALTSSGHFENVGDTRRQGVELNVAGLAGRARWTAAYTFLNATFETPLTLSSPNHPEAVDGEIAVAPGARLPGIPRHNLKLGLDATIGRTSLAGTFATTSSAFLRGDEANLLDPVDGYAVVSLSARHALGRRVTLAASVTNLFGSDYSTFGLLGEADEVLGDEYDDPRFVSPASPFGIWVGMEFRVP
jgi:outer membrane receptor protein involved in Fe transport